MSVRRDPDDLGRFDPDELRAEMRQAWSELQAPASDAPLDAPDAESQAVHAWMRAAFDSLEAPELSPKVLRAPRELQVPRRRPVLRLLPSTLAALGSAAAVVLMARFGGTPMDRPEPPIPLVADAQPTARLRTDGSVEMRSGSVRLILVTPQPSNSDTEAVGANPEPPSETLSR